LSIQNDFTDQTLRLADLGSVNYFPFLGRWALLLWIFPFGLGEEIGWRGFALPQLQKGRSTLSATLILAGLWALWHFPQFFYVFDPRMAIGWLIGLCAGAVIPTFFHEFLQFALIFEAQDV
jgi:membrane protease YdiL (CAAX protease family)